MLNLNWIMFDIDHANLISLNGQYLIKFYFDFP